MKDEKDEATSFFALKDIESKPNVNYNLVLRNRDDSLSSEDISFKVIFTEKAWESVHRGSGGNILPRDFDEVTRIKPKVPGLKESSFIQGTKYVMEAFSVASLTPFVPKSMKAYQAEFRTGPNADDSFMPGLSFEVHEQSSDFWAEVYSYYGEDDLFITLLSFENSESKPDKVGRSSLGKYMNSIGPLSLTKGKYKILIHPDIEAEH
jgi:hypothetical protein